MWFRVPGPSGEAHQAELDRFQQEIGDAVDFRTVTYPEVISRISVGPPGWIDYVRERYSLT
jgi:hypothetical protein